MPKIKKRPHVPKELASPPACPVCLDVLGGKYSHTAKLPCGHIFCDSCIVAWLSTKETCPLCRAEGSYSLLCFENKYVTHPLPDDALVVSPPHGFSFCGFVERGHAICKNVGWSKTEVLVLNFLNSNYIPTSTCVVPTPEFNNHRPIYTVGSGAVAFSKRVDLFKYIINVVDIANNKVRCELGGIHYEPLQICFSHNDRFLVCISELQIMVWDSASGTRLHTFPNLHGFNASYHTRIAASFSKNELLHVYYQYKSRFIISYDMQTGDVERYIELGEDLNLIDFEEVYEQSYRSVLFGEEYFAAVSRTRTNIHLDVYHLKAERGGKCFGPETFYDKKFSFGIEKRKMLRQLTFNGKDTIAAFFGYSGNAALPGGLIHLFSLPDGGLLKTFDMNINIRSLVYYGEDELAGLANTGSVTIWKS